MNLKILTYNIHGGKGRDGVRDFRRIGAFLKDQLIDIALIQELDTLPSDRDTQQDIADLQTDRFSHFVAGPAIIGPHGWSGNALLSRFTIQNFTLIDISDAGCEPRNILEVFIETDDGPLHIVNTHKGLGYFERRRQIRKLNTLLARKSDIPLVVGGDINEWQIFSPGLRKLNHSLQPVRAGATFPTMCPFLHLDRMWCRPKRLATNSKVLKTKETRIYSDHFPLLLEINLSKASLSSICG